MISTAGDAALSVADSSTTNTGKLVNGSFAPAQTLQAGTADPGDRQDLDRADLE